MGIITPPEFYSGMDATVGSDTQAILIDKLGMNVDRIIKANKFIGFQVGMTTAINIATSATSTITFDTIFQDTMNQFTGSGQSIFNIPTQYKFIEFHIEGIMSAAVQAELLIANLSTTKSCAERFEDTNDINTVTTSRFMIRGFAYIGSTTTTYVTVRNTDTAQITLNYCYFSARFIK